MAKKEKMTYEQALKSNSLEDWTSYWKRCRLVIIRYDQDLLDDPDNLLVIRYKDTMKRGAEIPVLEYRCRKESICFQGLRQVYPNQTDALIEQATQSYYEALVKDQQDLEDYLKYKENGNIEVQIIDKSTPMTFEGIRNASVEELFQTKLEIFESPPVQETDKKEYRANIRKSESIIEAIYWYYLISNDQETTDQQANNTIDSLLGTDSETLFKYKLEIFEREDVQNSENKEARSKIRKATTLLDMLIAYNEILNETKET